MENIKKAIALNLKLIWNNRLKFWTKRGKLLAETVRVYGNIKMEWENLLPEKKEKL